MKTAGIPMNGRALAMQTKKRLLKFDSSGCADVVVEKRKPGYSNVDRKEPSTGYKFSTALQTQLSILLSPTKRITNSTRVRPWHSI
jgi:hypothetical protein